MKNLISQCADDIFYDGYAELSQETLKKAAYLLIDDMIDSPEFAGLYAQRTGGNNPPPRFDLGLGNHVNQKWSKAMSALTDAMTAVGAAIAASKTAVDPVHIKAIDDGIAALQAHDSAEDAEIADVTNALTALSTAATGTTAGAGATGGAGGDVGGETGSTGGAV